MRDNQKVLSPCTFGMTKTRNCVLFLNIISLCLNALSPMLFQFAYPFKLEAFFLVPQVLINSIYDAFIASKIPTMKVSFQILKQIGPRGLNLESMGDKEGPQKPHLVAAAIAMRGMGWCINLREQNISSQISSSFHYNFLTPLP